MDFKELIPQIFGIIGLILSALSYQEKNNKNYFIKQGLSGLMFSVNFMLIGAVSAALFNVINLVRGVLLSKNDHKPWRCWCINGLYTACFVFSLSLIFNNPFQIFLSSLTYIGLISMTYFM